MGGFSQGAILSVHIGLTFPHKLGGILACSGFLCPQTDIKNKEVKILATNGDEDELINYDLAYNSYLNSSIKNNVEFVQLKNTGHTISLFAI